MPDNEGIVSGVDVGQGFGGAAAPQTAEERWDAVLLRMKFERHEKLAAAIGEADIINSMGTANRRSISFENA